MKKRSLVLLGAVFISSVVFGDYPLAVVKENQKAVALYQNPQQSYQMASDAFQKAYAAYSGDIDQVRAQFPNHRVDSFQATTGIGSLTQKSPFGYVISKINNQSILEIDIAIRGTVTTRDAITDLTGMLEELSPKLSGNKRIVNTKVHSGFQAAALSLFEELKHVLSDLKRFYGKKLYKKAKICLTGHSLGGAMATLCAFGLSQNSFLAPKGVESVVTFGAPAVGNQTFVRSLNETLNQHHFSQNLDPVSHLRFDEAYVALPQILIPSQHPYYNGTMQVHGLDGYKDSLDIHYNKKEDDKGASGKLFDEMAPLIWKGVNCSVQIIKDSSEKLMDQAIVAACKGMNACWGTLKNEISLNVVGADAVISFAEFFSPVLMDVFKTKIKAQMMTCLEKGLHFFGLI